MTALTVGIPLFFATNVDTLLLLLSMLLLYPVHTIVLSQLAGAITVIALANLASQILNHLVPTWSLGLLGIIPIILAFRVNVDLPIKQDILKKSGAYWLIYMLYLSSSSDNLISYSAVFTASSLANRLAISAILLILTGLLPVIMQIIYSHTFIKSHLIRYQAIITRVAYFTIGIYILFITAIIPHLIQLLLR
ncbi:cadmium resistance protein CadD [Weissella oryzae SG25]|uniref:Cadmium resistance protein CadD n=1 Tax=Weissella oryzae (strain DSM 25784 / JCM 18191 / LMG 30913 / SG25) TaxID=1329250 RepID=A0A069CVZ8_WEIOS|nr:cadmium resistance transporter [Weissella oryzae]GAK31388.1 cadmium resistance protein CadD [Weissella oryzae SG25]